ncbi:MAG TPA: hypothetical protein VFN88_14055, partial [Caulobacteraceae bacterium]|nr:hypothetical protein [Caulobacteraceae bacterium]
MQSVVVETEQELRPHEGLGDAVFKRLDPTALARFTQFRDSPLLDEGRVNVIALDPIADRLADRWASRKEQVYEHLERALNRKLGATDFFLRVSDTVYLVAQPSAGRFGAQALCVRALDEVVSFFLGPGPRHDVQVHKVTDLSVNQIVAVPIDRSVLAEAERQESKSSAAAIAEAKGDATLLSPARWSPFVASNGIHVRVSCFLEPVF